jgi:hypothetical protein
MQPVIYARSDVQSITVSEAHRGCGTPHARPEGERPWGLACSCEDFLRGDPNMWSVHADEVPLSHNEERAAAAAEKNAHKRQLDVVSSAGALLALLAGPRDVLAGAAPRLVPAGAECRKCASVVGPGVRFCGHCGSPVLREIEGAA